jgi:hypothetical protein
MENYMRECRRRLSRKVITPADRQKPPLMLRLEILLVLPTATDRIPWTYIRFGGNYQNFSSAWQYSWIGIPK